MSIIEFYDKIIPIQPREKEYGNREYKLHLDYRRFDKKKSYRLIEKKASQMLFRLTEGGGKALYLIGISDHGNNVGVSLNTMIVSIVNFVKITKIIGCNLCKLRIYKGKSGYIATIRLTQSVPKQFDLDLY